ncbi:MAG: fused MFS/spermidine synthase [Desulfobacterales bacterium]|nr:fused MFS/spermidine synthase [Desulfobacterales bacterium]
MARISILWRANLIAFTSSFCVMVIELIASRILAPHIGVSLYTWTSIIGVILAGVAIGNYLGGKMADRYPSPPVLAAILFCGALLTVGILPATRMVTSAGLFSDLPPMLDFTFKTALIFFFPALLLSMVSPMAIKLTLADLGNTGGVVGTIYAFSTAGAILGTFMTGFFLILWFGTHTIVWLLTAILILAGMIILVFWKLPAKEGILSKKAFTLPLALVMALSYAVLFQFKESWREKYFMQSNYFTIRVQQDFLQGAPVRVLFLDKFDQSYVIPDKPEILVYDYLKVLAEVIRYFARENPSPRVLHLGGGGYCLPRYMDLIYPDSLNEVVEIDPAVTLTAQKLLGLPLQTDIRTFNQDARSFLIKRGNGQRYDIVVGDVFNDYSTPFHLSTLEFSRLVKSNMTKEGIYLLNVNDYEFSQYTPSFVHTLKQVFKHVYLFSVSEDWEKEDDGSFAINSTDRIILASDQPVDLSDYMRVVTNGGQEEPAGYPLAEKELQNYLARRKPLLLTDDYAPTDILLAPIFKYEHSPKGPDISLGS